MALSSNFAPLFALHAGSATVTGAIVLYSLLANLAVTCALTPLFGALRISAGNDFTSAADYA